ncbi:S41 family peptidase [Brevundimonas faecalis]|uniref:S41 family peptidase n=1 Tax=Brevundimonas faecalis TaxID=947378 RepID=UPI00360BAC0A
MSLHSSLIRGAAAIALLTAGAPAPDAREAWSADYLALKQGMEAQYANLTWFASPESGRDLPALDRRTRGALEAATTEDEARAALMAFLGAFRDAHLAGRPAYAPALPETKEPEEPDIKSADPANRACPALGYGGTQAPFSLPIETLAGFELETDGEEGAFRSGVMTVDGRRVGVVRIPSFSTDRYVSLCRQNWTAEGVDKGGDVNLSALERAMTAGWYRELAGILRGFADRKVDAVLVDIGGNGGGDDSGDIAARLFTDRLIKSSPLLVKKGAAAEAYRTEQVGEVERGLSLKPDADGERILSQALTQLRNVNPSLPAGCDLSWVWREQRAWAPFGACSDLVQIGTAGGPLENLPAEAIPQPRIARRVSWSIDARDHWGAWSGPVYVLMDGRTASSAEMFAATLQNNGVARLAGIESAGAGCGAMGPDGKVSLPATGLVFSFPTCVRLRSNGEDEVAGLRPDLPLRQTQNESRRARAGRLFARIADEVAAKAAP